MVTEGYTAPEWMGGIRRYPRFWNSIRPRMLLVKGGVPGLEPYLDKLQALYPALRPTSSYLTVGCLRTGGTTEGNTVLIGVELVTGNAALVKGVDQENHVVANTTQAEEARHQHGIALA